MTCQTYVSIEVVYIVWHIPGSISTEKFIQHLKKINVSGFKGLYSFIFKI